MKKIVQKFQSMQVSLKATIAFAISSFAISGINYFTTPIFTRLLTTSEYGVVSVYQSWFTIIQVFATLTLIYPGILNVGLYENKENRWKYLSTILGLSTISSIVLLAIFAVFYREISSVMQLPASIIALMLITFIVSPATTFWTYKQRYEYSYRLPFIISVGSAVLGQIIAILVVYFVTSHKAEWRLWSAGLITIFVGLVLYIYIMFKGRTFYDFPVWKETTLVAFPLIPHYLASVVLTSTDRIMINYMVGNDKAGIYALTAVISSLGVLAWRALSVSFSPFINEKLGARALKEIDIAVKPLMIFVGAFSILAAMLAPEIIKILATSDYYEGIYVVPPVAGGVFLHVMYNIFAAVSFFHKKSQMIMVATMTASISNIILNYVFIKYFGYIAAGYTTLIANIILTGMHYNNVRKIEKQAIYNGKFLLAVSCIVIGISLLCNFLYAEVMFAVRYMMALGVLVFLWMYRKKLIDALTNMKV